MTEQKSPSEERVKTRLELAAELCGRTYASLAKTQRLLTSSAEAIAKSRELLAKTERRKGRK
jgi:hypothetical protein